MQIKATVLAEQVQVRESREYVTITCMEATPQPLLQMFDYGLKDEERVLKGTLVGKTVNLRVSTIRGMFAGRPQLVGSLEVVK